MRSGWQKLESLLGLCHYRERQDPRHRTLGAEEAGAQRPKPSLNPFHTKIRLSWHQVSLSHHSPLYHMLLPPTAGEEDWNLLTDATKEGCT